MFNHSKYTGAGQIQLWTAIFEMQTEFSQNNYPYQICSAYDYCIDIYDNYCIRGGKTLKSYSSYPF